MSLNYEQCRRLVQAMQRFADHRCTRRHAKGIYLRQFAIEPATPSDARRATLTADSQRVRITDEKWVRTSYIVSDQRCLRRRNLLYAMRHFPEQQRKGNCIPMLVHLGGRRYYLWNGNHRTTAMILAGMERIRADVIRKRP